MKRPEQHITDAAGERQLRSVLEPLGWTVNKIEHDYGVDFEVEVFHSGKTTGVAFKVQLKSSKATKYSSSGDFISQPLDLDAALYLCRELRSPVLLIHADVEQKKTYWLALQLDLETIRKLAKESQSDSITLRIPTCNGLPDSLLRLLGAVGQIGSLLASRVIIETPVRDFVASIRDRLDSEQLIREFKMKADAVKLSIAQSLLATGSIDEARAKLTAVLADPESSIENKFPALIILEGVEERAFREGKSTFKAFPEIKAYIADKLWALVRKGPAYLKFYGLIARKAAELSTLAERDSALYMNWVENLETGDPFWKAFLMIERGKVALEVVAKYRQCLRLAQYAANSGHRWMLGESLLRVVSAVSVFNSRLRGEGLVKSATAYTASALQLCRLAAWIADERGDEQGKSEAVLAAPMIDFTEDSPALKWAEQTVNSIQDPLLRKVTAEGLEGTTRELRQGPPSDTPPIKDLVRMFEEMAAGLRIDLSDRDDPIAERVRIGIADLDPSRVLKDCQHIFLSFGQRGMLADWLRLPTAGNKIVHCDLHRYAIEGLDLDGTYAVFKETYCRKCLDGSPRAESWEYSEKWQQEENRKHTKFLADFERRRRVQTP